MAKVLSEEKLKEAQQRIEMMFKIFDAVKDMPEEPEEAAYNKVLDVIIREDVPNLIATILAKDAEIERLRKHVCDKCGGSGYDGVLVGRACSKCNGSGRP